MIDIYKDDISTIKKFKLNEIYDQIYEKRTEDPLYYDEIENLIFIDSEYLRFLKKILLNKKVKFTCSYKDVDEIVIGYVYDVGKPFYSEPFLKLKKLTLRNFFQKRYKISEYKEIEIIS